MRRTRKPTIAEKRWTEVVNLARIKCPEGEIPYAVIREADRNMNSLYRLIGLSERNVILSNTERTANLKSTAESEDREYKWNRRITKTFWDTYGLELIWPGIYPKFRHDEILLYFYD